MDSTLSPVLTSGLGASTPSNTKDPAKIREAAVQFESLLIGQMLKSMHEDEGEGWLGTGEDQTASSAMGMADEFLAQSISKRGGLGLANMISRQLDDAASSSSGTTEPVAAEPE